MKINSIPTQIIALQQELQLKVHLLQFVGGNVILWAKIDKDVYIMNITQYKYDV